MSDTDTLPTVPLDYTVDRLLADWHAWRRRYRLGKGYSSQDATCRDHRSGTHWDWWNGAAEDRGDEIQMRAVDEAIDRVPNQPRRWNTALQFEAANLHAGAAVWSSPVLPRDPEERKVLVLEARNMLARELRRDGLI